MSVAEPIIKERQRVMADVAYQDENFPALRLARSSRLVRQLAKWLVVALVFATLAMLLVPWQQSIKGDGAVVAFDPVHRPQAVQARVKGVIAEIGEGIGENAYVKKGQLIYRIVDQDPEYLSRLRAQVENKQQQLTAATQRMARTQDQLAASSRVVEAKAQEIESLRAAQGEAISAAEAYVQMAKNKLVAEQAGYQAAVDAVWQAELDFDRKKELQVKGFESGLKFQEADLKLRQAKAKRSMAEQYVRAAENEIDGKENDRDAKRQEWEGKVNKSASELEKSRSEVSKAEVDIAKVQEDIEKIENELAKLETQLARQQTQDVVAPRDGYIMRLLAYDESALVKDGDTLFTIVPETNKMAVQLWVDGNDAPLIAPGRHVRLQFEGWPAVQFSGWPNVAVGTFGGKVALVDPTDDGEGRFRVVVVPAEQDSTWPDYPYLRQGVRAHGWVLLDQVPLGYEFWRRMNGFPPALKSKDDSKPVKPPKVKV
ncbi:MAG: HlyD family efflux transporter periplasmic adaptor subunit [Pirellulales bacterium]